MPAARRQSDARARSARRVDVIGRGTLVALPPVVQPGTVAGAPRNAGQVVATFDPARPGRAVLLERRTGNDWRQVARKRQDALGVGGLPGAARAPTAHAPLTRGVATSVTGTVVSRAWTPAFEDTFSGAGLDTVGWNDQRREHESVYAPRTCARTDPAARRVEGGVLHLGIALDPDRLDQRCSYTTDEGAGEQAYLLTSQVATEHTRLFRHGIIAARMKPQRAKGMHSGFWMLPEATKFTDGDPRPAPRSTSWSSSARRRTAARRSAPSSATTSPGWQNVQARRHVPRGPPRAQQGARWWDEFHVFSVEWTPTEYVFRVDGREYHRETNAVSQAQQYLVLSMLASDHELAELTADELGDTAQVDWVRVFDAQPRPGAAHQVAARPAHGDDHASDSITIRTS